LLFYTGGHQKRLVPPERVAGRYLVADHRKPPNGPRRNRGELKLQGR
jgi:hypothetical protein